MSAVKVLAEVLTLTLATELDWTWEAGPGTPESGAETVRGIAEHLAEVIAGDPRIAVIEVPAVGHKAQGETDSQRYREIARRIREGYMVGGYNSRVATAQLLERVARAAGGDDQ